MSDPVLTTFAYESVRVDARGQVLSRLPHTAQSFVEPPGLELVEIPAGRFSMGSPRSQGSDEERPQHLVSISRFFMARGLVTQAQWQAVMGRRPPCRFSGDERPVENVAWGEAQAFCQRLARLTGRAYRLPSEAQWEYACRAGGSAPFHTGETLTTDLANYCGEHTFRAEPAGLYRHVTTPAGMFLPNAFGLYDMHGNLWEWCADTWHADYSGAPASEAPWQSGGDRAARPVRGGSWHDVPSACRSAARARYEAGQGDDFVGFRVVWQPEAAA
jgi:formylglycine-generating enzyme required for sulfatase activity